MDTYVVMPQYLINKSLRDLSETSIKSIKDTADVTLISVNDGAYKYNLGKLSDVYLENKKNKGFAKTCNKGFQWVFDNVKEDCYIVCANNDIEVYKGWIEELKYPYSEWDNIAVTGICHSNVKIKDGKHLSEHSDTKIVEGGQAAVMQDGGLWMSKKSILEKVGTFDERFERGGYEDVDLFLRMRDTFGMKIIMSERAWYWHKEGATRWGIDEGGFNKESKGYENRNRIKFKEKWGFDYIGTPVWKSNQLVN